MKRYPDTADSDCAIAHALGVVGDWWTLLVLRDLAAGVTRFSALADSVGVSRKVLAERLTALGENGVVERVRYSERPPRDEYRLTAKGLALVPVLIALQTWGEQHVLGDGSLTATGAASSHGARRVHQLVGRALPPLALADPHTGAVDPVARSPWTVLYCFPGAWLPGVTGGRPAGWSEVPGAVGCTLESTTFRDHAEAFAARDATVRGVSTQRPDQLAEFAEQMKLPFALLSDQDLQLASALRLPTFRVAGLERLKRLTLIIDADRVIRAVLYPVTDPAASVTEALASLDELVPASAPLVSAR
jgi:DNA-binding HxlR family transcriptional regulator/peroxiredoxin